MAVERPLQSSAALLEESQRDSHVAQQRRQGMVGDPMPLTLGDTELAARLGIGLTVFYKRKRRGDFLFLELKPQLPASNTKYSGLLVAKWLRGEPVAVPGAPRAHFGSARDRGDQLVAVHQRPSSGRTGRPQRSTSVGETPTAANSNSVARNGVAK